MALCEIIQNDLKLDTLSDECIDRKESSGRFCAGNICPQRITKDTALSHFHQKTYVQWLDNLLFTLASQEILNFRLRGAQLGRARGVWISDERRFQAT